MKQISTLLKQVSALTFIIFGFVVPLMGQSLTFEFHNTLVESNNASPALNVLGTGSFQVDSLTDYTCIPKVVYHFDKDQGLQFDNNSAGNFLSDTYTIEMYFKFDSDMGFRRIIDFSNGTSDSGLYATGFSVDYFDAIIVNNTALSLGNYAHIGLSRDSTTDVVDLFINGSLQGTFIDTGRIAVLNSSGMLNFFQDDLALPGETSSGNIALLKLYNYTLSASEVLDNYNNLSEQFGIISSNVNVISGCDFNNEFEFINASDSLAGNITYSWNFGDGNFSTLSMPTHSYAGAGVYNAYLIASTTSGCIDSSLSVIEVFAPPVVSLGPDLIICPNDSVLLDAGITSALYQWNTGATGQTITVGDQGIYGVTVTVAVGCSASDSISVSELPQVPTPIISQNANTLSSSAANTYQWYQVPGGAISGATAQSYSPAASGSFYVVVTDSSGCESLPSNTFNFVWVSVNEIQLSSIKITPNPASYLVNLAIPIAWMDKLYVEVFDIIGNKVYQQEFTNLLDVSALRNGIYLMRIHVGNDMITEKLVIER